jgi:hypothetical protein
MRFEKDICSWTFKACFKRRPSHVPNALKIIDNQLKCLMGNDWKDLGYWDWHERHKNEKTQTPL